MKARVGKKVIEGPKIFTNKIGITVEVTLYKFTQVVKKKRKKC